MFEKAPLQANNTGGASAIRGKILEMAKVAVPVLSGLLSGCAKQDVPQVSGLNTPVVDDSFTDSSGLPRSYLEEYIQEIDPDEASTHGGGLRQRRDPAGGKRLRE